jgi:hypothetical protein
VSYSSGETPRMICARRSKEARDPEKKANYERMLLWIDNLVDIMKVSNFHIFFALALSHCTHVVSVLLCMWLCTL